ncbi:hypothetical protein [Odoribacter laneus]|uniref:Uncharacterized protein n=1 Tax=Odoribacter laneus YIT 12061 TaxID=742817 RepID=H1DHR5_9BACT|nr:hypothetical protein [Odoribacter laneus]EHP47194.1 hypothetical protein HMPREF9449_01801 [Odoribacter laneus YIT 12061]
MNKSYHQHCQEEHDEAIKALREAETKTKDNISIVYEVTPARKRIISVSPSKLNATIKKLKKAKLKILSITPYNQNSHENKV